MPGLLLTPNTDDGPHVDEESNNPADVPEWVKRISQNYNVGLYSDTSLEDQSNPAV